MNTSDIRKIISKTPSIAKAISSSTFRTLREKSSFLIDGEREFIIHGDITGTEEELLWESLVRGAKCHRIGINTSSNSEETLCRELFLELDDEGRQVVLNYIRK